MNPFLLTAAILSFIVGALHSVLGERFIVARLIQGDVRWTSHEVFKRRTIRFAWHLTTVLFWGFGLLLFNMAQGMHALFTARGIVAFTFAVCAVLSLVATRGKHLSWVLFALIAVLTVV